MQKRNRNPRRNELDQLDHDVIAILQEDGRLSASEVAARIGGVAERTVRNRISALLENRQIVIGAIPDPTVSEHEVQAEALIQVESGKLQEVATRLAEFDEIGYLAATCGKYNLTASLFANSHAELLDFVEHSMAAIPGVRHVSTKIILRLFKVYGTRTSAVVIPKDGVNLEAVE